MAGSARYIGAKIDLGAYENANAVDITVQENCAFELAVDVGSGDKVYWDLSGTGTGAFVATSASFYVDALKQGLTPGVYYLRSKVVGKDGKTKSENTVTLQVLKSAPLVSAEIMPTLFDNAIVISFDARFFGQIPDRSWRVDWGDGSSSVSYKDAFTAGRFYEKTERSVAYSIALTLVSGDGLDEYVYNVAQFTVPKPRRRQQGDQELEEEDFTPSRRLGCRSAERRGNKSQSLCRMFAALESGRQKKDSRFDAVESAGNGNMQKRREPFGVCGVFISAILGESPRRSINPTIRSASLSIASCCAVAVSAPFPNEKRLKESSRRTA